MKKKAALLFTFFCFLFASGCASPGKSLPSFSVEMKSTEGKVQLIDRKILGIQLDVTQAGKAILRVSIKDILQIDKRTYEIPWQTQITLMEGADFKIIRK